MQDAVKSPARLGSGAIALAAASRKLRLRFIALVAAALAAMVGAPVAYVLVAQNGASIPGTEAASDFIRELLNRSPGKRTHGQLIKTKKYTREMLSSATMPRDNAVSSAVPASLVDLLSPPLTFSDIVLPTDSPPMPFVQLASLDDFVPVGIPGGGGGVLFPGGGGGGGGGGGTPPGETPEVPPVVSAVPEPSTWATLLIGFLFVGGALRRQPVRQRAIAARARA